MRNSAKFAKAVKDYSVMDAQVTFSDGNVELHVEINKHGVPLKVWMFKDEGSIEFMNRSLEWVMGKTRSGVDILVANLPCSALWDVKDRFRLKSNEDHANVFGLLDYMTDN